MSNGKAFDADVAIIGYGPTGLTAALCLGQYGIKTIALEREPAIYPRARAVTVCDSTMRCFQSLGLDRDLAEVMDETVALRWITYSGHEITHLTFPPSALGVHPRSYAIYQPRMEEVMRARMPDYADVVDVRFGVEVVAVDQDADGVTVTSRDVRNGAETTVRTRYALACDGGSSKTRDRLGVKMLGETVEKLWVVVDARVKRWWPNRNILTFWSDKQRPVVDIALALGNHRWEFPLEAHESEKDFATQEQLWPLLNSLGVTDDLIEIHQHAFYKHHVRHAERWREGRIFLLGDAAHLMPPWAGQGMQSGIRDAFNLSWKLREVLKGRLPDRLLDTYEVERAPTVAMMTAVAVQMGRIIKQQLTDEEMAALAPSPDAPPEEPPLLRPPFLESGWVRGSVSADSAVGKTIPQPRVANSAGKLCLLDELLGDGFTLLGDGVDPRDLLSPGEKAEWDALGARYAKALGANDRGDGPDNIVDLNGILQQWMRGFGVRVVALRPDRFVAASDVFGLAVPAPEIREGAARAAFAALPPAA
ncbi:3-(3-hydroxy-phenyl)propionate hydroxylase [Roseiarcus fermentans]|uniref:3-(3-hydroxy-phenyl)propionate hydroxylase n=1 Tax=Roseiarcus fermentans TaxID=1473586 RepID=A0A366F3P5_9HYPH|nr:bifunctional 3-(3-hydroxy-phenyl)propionate/3-hydroxycinnamic acid hydroxylase [Roseiarcus fermentans]RBP09227.1 3-(3-hydroxy-phenyl)propionate hydroxylase [Roseiarcus fermentans]